MIYFAIGMFLGMIVMIIICEEAHKTEVNDLRKQIEKDSRAYYDAVNQLESEIMTQRNVVKALNDDNVWLRKKLKRKENEYQS